MSKGFNFLGSPTVNDIERLREYLDGKYGIIDEQIKAVQHEINTLTTMLTKLKKSEGQLAAVTGKERGSYALADYLRAPVVNEDHSYFEKHNFNTSQTGTVVDLLTKPWIDHIKRERETLDYKIRKTQYLIEQKQLQKKSLIDLRSQITDEEEA